MQKKKVMKRGKTIYALKITLRYCKPLIWRRVFVDANTKLPDLHKIIQTVMGWTNTHLHEFRIYNDVYCEPDEEIYHEYFDYTKVRLSDLVRHTGFKFYYDYDFGDGWEHEIKIEKIFTYDGNLKFPVYIDGKRRCPPEDCGGPSGYEDILKIIKDPEHKEYEEWMTWLGDDFDPKWFSVEDTNELLRSKNYGCIMLFT